MEGVDVSFQQNSQSPNLGNQSIQSLNNEHSRVHGSHSVVTFDVDSATSSNNGIFNGMSNKQILTEICKIIDNFDDPNEWFKNLYRNIDTELTRIPKGGWDIVTNVFNQKFNSNKSKKDIQNLYNQIKNRMISNKDGRNNQSELGLISDDYNMVTNVTLYENIKHELAKSIKMYCTDAHPKTYHHSLQSTKINYQVLNFINIIIKKDKISNEIKSLCDYIDVIYACQATYYSYIDQKKKNPSGNYFQSMQKKIDINKMKMELIENHDQNKIPDQRLVKLCKMNGIHSNDSQALQELKCKFEDKITNIETKLNKIKNKSLFSKMNYMFENNRKKFYRQLQNQNNIIGDNLNHDETLSFWNELWSQPNQSKDWTDLVNTFEPIQNNTNMCRERIKELTMKVINNLHFIKWKAPGNDFVYNFFIDKIDSLHDKLCDLVTEAILDPDSIPDKLYNGVTFLIPKVMVANKPDELRPITCLSNTYKIISKVMNFFLREICTLNDIISDNQMGARPGMSAKLQILVNKCLNQDNDNQLKTAYVDVKKAYDSIQHKYIHDILEKLELPTNIKKFINRMLALQKTTLKVGNCEIGTISILNGILQGDSLSPQLFILALEPLSRILNLKCDMVYTSDYGIGRNHLSFIDDIKLIANNQSDLNSLCKLTNEIFESIGLSINEQKSANNTGDIESFGDMVNDDIGYKYLGILEDSNNLFHENNKIAIREKVFGRVESICNSKLSAKNLFHAINEFAIAPLNYYLGIIDFTEGELEEFDKGIRRILAKYQITRRSSNMDRLYLHRKELGRGLQNIVEKNEIVSLNLAESLDGNLYFHTIWESEKTNNTSLGNIKEKIKYKYQMSDDEVNLNSLKIKQKEKRMNIIGSKQLHSKLFDDDDNIIDKVQSSLWLRKLNITPQEEAMLCKLQDRNMYFPGLNKKCPHCNQGKKTVDHLATYCGKMLNFDYKKRHDEVVRLIHYSKLIEFGINKCKKLNSHRMQKLVVNDRVKIKSDMEIVTTNKIDHNKPDLLIHDSKINEITLIEIGITNKDLLPRTETTKGRKYDLLGNELKLLHKGVKIRAVPVVITWDALVTKFFKKHLSLLGISLIGQAYIQYKILKKTLESILIDVKGDYDVDIDNNDIFDE